MNWLKYLKYNTSQSWSTVYFDFINGTGAGGQGCSDIDIEQGELSADTKPSTEHRNQLPDTVKIQSLLK